MTIILGGLIVGAWGLVCLWIGTLYGLDKFDLDEDRIVEIDGKKYVIASFVAWPVTGRFSDDSVNALDVTFRRLRSS